MAEILLFIPAYNCKDQIRRVVDKVKACTIPIAEVLAVDNGSSDGSVAELRTCLKDTGLPYRILTNAENYGLGGSHKIAFEHAIERGFDYCLVLHGDDQADIRDMQEYVLSDAHAAYDCVLGARFGRGARRRGYSLVRMLGNVTLNGFISLVFNKKVTDMGSGLNLYRTDFLKSRFYVGFPDDLTFNVYMLLYSLLSEAHLHFFPISWTEEDQRSNAKAFRQAAHIIRLTVQTRLFPGRIREAQASALPDKYSFAVVDQR